MGNALRCLKTKHMLLQEDCARTDALHFAATALAEIAHTFEHRREDIEKQISVNASTRAQLLREFREHKRSREETQRVLTDLDVKQKVAQQRLDRVNSNILHYKRYEGDVLELQSTMDTTSKMADVTAALSKVGVKVRDLDKHNDAVDRVMGEVSDMTRNQGDYLSDENAEHVGNIREDVSSSVADELDMIEDMKADEFALTMAAAKTAKAGGKTKKFTHTLPSSPLRHADEEDDEERKEDNETAEIVFRTMT